MNPEESKQYLKNLIEKILPLLFNNFETDQKLASMYDDEADMYKDEYWPITTQLSYKVKIEKGKKIGIVFQTPKCEANISCMGNRISFDVGVQIKYEDKSDQSKSFNITYSSDTIYRENIVEMFEPQEPFETEYIEYTDEELEAMENDDYIAPIKAEFKPKKESLTDYEISILNTLENEFLKQKLLKC